MVIIGREPPADIVIPSPTISYRHAEIHPLGGGYYQLTDLSSTNGTFVNGQRIQSTHILLSDRVQFGAQEVDLRQFEYLLAAGSQQQWAQPPPAPPPVRPQVLPAPRPPAPVPAPVPAPRPVTPRPGGSPRPAARRPGMGSEVAVALAMQQTYGGKAFWVWVLYWFMWLPGAVMNIVYWNEAKRTRRITGVAPSGMGCLTFLLVTHILLPLLVLALFVMLLIAAPATLNHFLNSLK